MRAGEFKGKDVLLFYKRNPEDEAENPTVTIIDEVEGFGLYVELHESGEKEVVAFSDLSGWKEIQEHE